jgi:hypothetical protein
MNRHQAVRMEPGGESSEDFGGDVFKELPIGGFEERAYGQSANNSMDDTKSANPRPGTVGCLE